VPFGDVPTGFGFPPLGFLRCDFGAGEAVLSENGEFGALWLFLFREGEVAVEEGPLQEHGAGEGIEVGGGGDGAALWHTADNVYYLIKLIILY
jgi:hypothetical protein